MRSRPTRRQFAASAELGERRRVFAGNLTKHDCSFADLSLTGSLTRTEIASFLRWARVSFDLSILGEYLAATPTAEPGAVTTWPLRRKKTWA